MRKRESGYRELAEKLELELDDALLERAMTHRSYAYENGGLPTNERLEFLGDAVLGLVVTDTLFRDHPDLSEGQLAKLRAAVVNMRALADVGRGLELGRFLRLGRGEETTGGRDKSSILGDAVEALIGAVYLACGFGDAQRLIHQLFDPLLERSSRLGAGLDWKTSLQELTAHASLGVPEYAVQESGPDHEKVFTARVVVGGRRHGAGTGRSKKEAEQQAAEIAWTEIRQYLGLADAEDSADPGEDTAAVTTSSTIPSGPSGPSGAAGKQPDGKRGGARGANGASTRNRGNDEGSQPSGSPSPSS